MADTQTIKDRVDIVQLISEYIPLKKAGVNWKACCPFHTEKTPSFMVNAEKQFWHCFGCAKGGDIFTFLQEMEGMDFPEALKVLAERAGVEIKSFKPEIDKSQKNRIHEVNAKAAYFFHQFFKTMPAATAARDYLRERGMTDASVDAWQVGFIPDQWDLLIKYLLKNNFTIDDLLAAGLAIRNENRRSYYDVFRGRIMFPIRDIYGNVIGFTGRILVETEHSGGKYVNTPQTAVFDKSRAVYGLDKAKMEIKNQDAVILVEGQMDVIANHAAGLANAVAASGTALTEGHLRLIKRYTNNILFAFDMDEAGIKAAKRGIDLAVAMGMNVKIITIPEGAGKDADECIKKSPDVWRQAVRDARRAMDWYWLNIFAKYNDNDPGDRQKIADELAMEIDKIPLAVEKESWLKKLSDRLGLDAGILKENMNRLRQEIRRESRTTGDADTPAVAPVKSLWERLQEDFWLYPAKQPALIAELYPVLKREYFTDPELLSLYDYLEKRYNNKEEMSFSGLPAEAAKRVDLLVLRAELELAGLPEKEILAGAENIITRLKKEWLRDKKEKLVFELNRAHTAGDKTKEDEILNLINELNIR